MSVSGARSIWVRHDVENFKKRLQALEAKVAAEGVLLTDSQIAALERKSWMMKLAVKSRPTKVFDLMLQVVL
jgi:hypothetical protein